MMRNSISALGLLAAITMLGCGCNGYRPEPVDIYPEDICALCKMAVSDHRFASEIVSPEEVHKFDDIGCLKNYRGMRTDLNNLQVFYMDYATGTWVPEDRAILVSSGASTPMGSGLVAFADSGAARAFLQDHPVDRRGE